MLQLLLSSAMVPLRCTPSSSGTRVRIQRRLLTKSAIFFLPLLGWKGCRT
jgi:hypothetical protein